MLTVKILNTMHRIFLLVFLSILPSTGTLLAQRSDTSYQEIAEVRIIKDFDFQYQRQLSRLRRVYPLAMHARMMLDDYENDLSGISKKRKQKKYTKKASKALKNDFHFDIKDLYQSEGKLLIRLIHRETDVFISNKIYIRSCIIRRNIYIYIYIWLIEIFANFPRFAFSHDEMVVTFLLDTLT